jgi:hypothetical protein
MFRNAGLRSFLTGLGVAGLLVACAPENVSSPAADLSASAAKGAPLGKVLGGALTGVVGAVSQTATGLTAVVDGILQPAIGRKKALKTDVTVTKVIGAKGGTISIKQAGLTVTFAPGALLQDTRITATANSGSLVSYDFGPHGTQFHAPVTITQDMRQTVIDRKLEQADSLFGGYMPNGIADISGDSVNVSEVHKSDTKIGTDWLGRKVMTTSSFIVSHFSGYILISGRSIRGTAN